MLTSLIINARKSDQIHTNILESTDQGIYVVQLRNEEKDKWRLCYLNQNMRNMFGIGEQELEKGLKGLLKLVHPDDKKKWMDTYHQLFKNKKSIQRSYRLIQPVTGKMIYIDESIKLREKNDEIELYHYISDISTEKTLTALLQSTNEELKNLGQINKAIIENKSLHEIGKIFLDTIGPPFSIVSSRLYTLNQSNHELTTVCENFEKGIFSKIEKRIGVKAASIIPKLTESNYLFQLIQKRETIITTDEKEIIKIVDAHADSAIIKPFVKWAVKLTKLKTFAIIPLCAGNKIVGLVTLASTQKFSDQDIESIHRYTEHIAGGLIKKILEQDIKTAEKKLASNQQLLLTSEEMGKIGSWEVNFVDMEDWSKNTTLWSDESYRIFGYEPQSVEVSYPFFLEHVHPEDVHLVSGNFQALFIPGSQHEVEYRIILKNGDVKNIHGKFYIVFNEKNRPLKMVGMSQDITARKKMEKALEAHNHILKEEVERQTRELKIANQSLDAFNHSISHDIKTPLRAMDLYLDLLKENIPAQDDNHEYVVQIGNCANEMKLMISTLMELAKFEKIELKKETVNMRSMINGCIHSLIAETTNSKVTFNVLQTPDIRADENLVKHILANLISNAIKYSSKKEHPIIEIAGYSDGAFTTYYIKDNGAGFDPKLANKLYKPFSRLHNDSEFEGNGAGLSIAERIITRHGGTIWAETEKGKGATFYFKLPN